MDSSDLPSGAGEGEPLKEARALLPRSAGEGLSHELVLGEERRLQLPAYQGMQEDVLYLVPATRCVFSKGCPACVLASTILLSTPRMAENQATVTKYREVIEKLDTKVRVGGV